MTVRSTNGAECGECPSTYPVAPPLSFTRLLEQAQAEVDAMMRLPMYQTNDEELRIKYSQSLLQTRLNLLEKGRANRDQQQSETYSNSHSISKVSKSLVEAMNNQGEMVAQAVHSQAAAVEQLAGSLFSDPIQVKNHPNELTLQRIASQGLPLKVQKDLVSMISCLAPDGQVPARQDLSLMWVKVERAIRSLGPNMVLEYFGHDHIKRFAPIILGDLIWAEFSHDVFTSWSQFKLVVDKKYGLTQDELIDAFYEMTQGKDESTPEFILRVERLRARYNEDPKTCFRQFKPKLNLEYRRGLAHLRRAAAIMGSTPELTWQMLVADAKSQTTYSSLTPEDANQVVQGFGQPEVTAPPKGIPAAISAIAKKPPNKCHFEQAVFASQHENRHCALCDLVGRKTAHTHNLERCYSNPKNPDHQPWSVRLRYNDITEKGLPMPECMKEYAEEQKGRWKPAQKPEENPEGNKDEQPPKVMFDKMQLSQFGQDLQALCEEGVEYDQAIEQAATVNFEYNHSLFSCDMQPDPCPSFMLFHQDDSPDLQAASQAVGNHQKVLLKRHLQALNQFSDEDLACALEEMDVDGNAVQPTQTIENPLVDYSSDSDSDDSSVDGELPVTQVPMQQAAQPTAQTDFRGKVDQDAQTGGVSAAGRRVIKARAKRAKPPKKEPTLGSEVNKMKILLPFFKGLQVKDNLRRLIMAKAGLEAYNKGDTVKVVAGTKVKQISEAQMKAEIQAYSEAGIDENVKSKLKQIKKAHQPAESTNMIHEIADSLKQLLEKLEPIVDGQGQPGATREVPENSFHFIPMSTGEGTVTEVERSQEPAQLVVVSDLPKERTGLPDWAPEGSVNARGQLNLSPCHYIATCGIGKGVCDAFLDTAGARTMMDLQTAESMNLDVEKTTANKYFGSFISASAVPTPYAGRVKGPVELRFSENVSFQIREIKIIQYPEPLVLIGTDVLGAFGGKGFSYTSVGINPRTLQGEVTFSADNGKRQEVCELVMWPKANGVIRSQVPAKRVSYAPYNEVKDIPARSLSDGVERSKRLVALIKKRGQRLR